MLDIISEVSTAVKVTLVTSRWKDTIFTNLWGIIFEVTHFKILIVLYSMTLRNTSENQDREVRL